MIKKKQFSTFIMLLSSLLILAKSQINLYSNLVNYSNCVDIMKFIFQKRLSPKPNWCTMADIPVNIIRFNVFVSFVFFPRITLLQEVDKVSSFHIFWTNKYDSSRLYKKDLSKTSIVVCSFVQFNSFNSIFLLPIV